MNARKTVNLNIPRTAKERVERISEWHCAGCGASVPDLVKRCNCMTMVACKDGHKSVWMIDPADAARSSEQADMRAAINAAHDHLHKLIAILPHNDSAYKETTDMMARLRAIIDKGGEDGRDHGR